MNALVGSMDNPIAVGISFISVAILALLAIAKPVMSFYREYRRTGSESAKIGVDEAKYSAESTLYTQLQDQLLANTRAIQKLQEERDEWFRKALTFEKEIERLKSLETSNEALKQVIATRDESIRHKDEEIRNLTRIILEMKDKIHALELRITRDEIRFNSTKDIDERNTLDITDSSVIRQLNAGTVQG